MKSCVVALKIDNILNGINPVYHHYESYPVVWAIQKNHIERFHSRGHHLCKFI